MMKRKAMHRGLGGALALLVVLGASSARAERRPPFGNDAAMLESRVREDIQRRVAPILEEMAPGQAELKYIDVRVNRPTALPAGAAPGFEDLTPGTEFVAERVEVALTLDSKLPAQFRKDLRALIKARLDALDVPVEVTESVIQFPTPRPQPPAPREPMPYPYAPAPPPPQQHAAQPAAAPAPAPVPPPPPAAEPPARGVPWAFAIGLAVLGVLIGGLIFALFAALGAIRGKRREEAATAPATGRAASPVEGKAAAPAVDHLPEVRRALREDRVLARRVMRELLIENQVETVAAAVELVGPSIVEDLRGDPACAGPLREAAALLVTAGRTTENQEVAERLHRRILKHRMVGSDDPVEQEFAFLLGLSAARLTALLQTEPAAVGAAALRYAPAHLRAAYLEGCSPEERAALAAAIASPKALSRDHLLDVAATLRARAIELAHLDTGETGDIDLAVELVEERPPAEQAAMLEAMRRADPARARAVEAALISDVTFELVGEDLLSAAVVAVPGETLARYLRAAPSLVASRIMSALPPTVAAALQEDLSLAVTASPRETAEARRAVFAALRGVLRARGLRAPQPAGAASSAQASKDTNDKGKVVAL
jgi:flagellar motor switch protein FliG